MTDENSEKSPVRIKWEVPLPWLLGVLAIIVGQAGIVYFGQIRQAEILVEQSSAIKDVLRQVRELNSLISSNNVKDVEHDMKIADHERRMQAAEFREMQRNAK